MRGRRWRQERESGDERYHTALWSALITRAGLPAPRGHAPWLLLQAVAPQAVSSLTPQTHLGIFHWHKGQVFLWSPLRTDLSSAAEGQPAPISLSREPGPLFEQLLNC